MSSKPQQLENNQNVTFDLSSLSTDREVHPIFDEDEEEHTEVEILTSSTTGNLCGKDLFRVDPQAVENSDMISEVASIREKTIDEMKIQTMYKVYSNANCFLLK